MRTLYSKGRGKDDYLTQHQRHYHLSSTVNFNLDLFMTALHRTTLPARIRLIEEGIVIVIFAIVEVEALLCLHEPLLRQRENFPRKRRWRNIAIDLLHEEIVEWETWCGPGAGERGRWSAPLYAIQKDNVLEGGARAG